MKKFLLVGLATLFVAGVCVAAGGPDQSDYQRTWDILKTRHVDTKITDTDLYYGAVKGLAAATNDPYTVFYTPKEAKALTEHLQGSFFGIGAIVEADREGNIMFRPMEGGPAEKAGMQIGDLLISIDGKPVAEIGKLDDVVATLHGDLGKPVKLIVYRPDAKKQVELVIVRGKIIPGGEAKLKTIEAGKKKFLVIPLHGFDPEGAKLFEKALSEIDRTHFDGVVLDLRNNPGGLVGISGDVVCSWKKDRPFVIFENRAGEQKELGCKRWRPTPLSDMPTVVLINKYSASASEITAGALQDFHKARIIGETSYGKGCAQVVEDFPDGSKLKYTTDVWKTPDNRSINKTGVKPDELVKALVDNGGDDEEKIAGDTKKKKKELKDVQMDRAIEFLTNGR